MNRKSFINWMAIFVMATVSVCFISCSSNDAESTGIAGTWVDGSTTMVLGRDGSYNLTNTSISSMPQYRRGTYSYNSTQSLLTVNVVAVEGQNSAYQQTYIVQTLTATTLVLLYTDGDVEGYYTRK